MNRREFLESVAILIGGLTVSESGLTLTDEQRAFLAVAPDYIAAEVEYFSAEQRRIVAAMAETIIPTTDTPGAIDAGTPRFIELMVSGWFTDAERQVFDEGLGELDRQTRDAYSASFDQLDTKTQIQLLEKLEEEAAGADWYKNLAYGGSEDFSQMPFICQFKELTAFGFFMSRVGATQVLRHNPFPGKFDGHLPLGPDDSSWAVDL